MNLFLTEDGVVKLGYYGLITQAECYGIKGMNCDGVRSFVSEVFRGEYGMKSDVWSFGTVLLEMMGITPYGRHKTSYLSTVEREYTLPFKERHIESEEWIDILKKCFADYRRGIVNQLLNVSVIG